MRFDTRVKLLIAGLVLLLSQFSANAASDGASQSLASPESFAAITDTAARSAALFAEAGKVLSNRALRQLPSGRRPPAPG